ncbi:MAG TPA: PEP/pyruvate-binding domain-containing protein [Candidatus Saccharimonadales bacterium]|nr:PEP/pyruvate-binding domain-containing protein [Candidatus Saccharimonadales bacterium]
MSEVPFEFAVFGGEQIGEKAALLKEYSGPLREVGFNIPRTKVIASETLEPLKTNLVLASETEVDRGRAAFLGSMIAAICASLGSTVAMVRSSAEGDARGTGVYRSVASPNHKHHIAEALQQVLSSYHTPQAVAFRQQHGLGGELAAMVQPLVGQKLNEDGEMYGPPLSGYGYSSTPHHSQGVIKVVSGIGGGLGQAGEVITPSDLEALKDRKLSFPSRPVLGLVASGVNKRLEKRPIGVHKSSTSAAEDIELPLGRVLRLFEPADLLERLRRLERLTGVAMYIEWALTVEEGGLRFWAVQATPLEDRHEIRL